jgi:hypothetical protein
MRRKPVTIKVDDSMQKGYTYVLTESEGRSFHPEFKPELTPKQMLRLGVFGGKYMTDCVNEYPRDWFGRAKLSPGGKDPSLNLFKVDASLPLSQWRANGWIYWEDPRGWFQWYCRYHLGRRCPDDMRQIRRWKAMKRHISQLKNACPQGDLNCRRRQRQALLHWAYDTRKI